MTVYAIIHNYMNMTYSYGLPWFGIWINSCFSQHAETLRQPYDVNFPPCHVLSEASHVRRGCILTKAFYSDLQPSLLFASFRRMPTNQWYTNINDSFPDWPKNCQSKMQMNCLQRLQWLQITCQKKGFWKKTMGSSPDCLSFLPTFWREWFISYRFNHSNIHNMPKLSVERLKTEAPNHWSNWREAAPTSPRRYRWSVCWSPTVSSRISFRDFNFTTFWCTSPRTKIHWARWYWQ